MTEGFGRVGMNRATQPLEGGEVGRTGADAGEFGGRKVTAGGGGGAGGVLRTVGRVLLAVVSLGISELVIHLAGRSARRESAPPEGNRARLALDGPGDGVERSKGKAGRAFNAAVEGSINEKFGHAGDLSVKEKFEDGVHFQFNLDANRATYALGGTTLPKDGATVTEAFRKALSGDALQAVTAILHQGASLAILEQCHFTPHGFVQGLLGAGGGKESRYDLTRGEGGRLEVTIEDRFDVGHIGRMDENGMPSHTMYDPSQSSVRTVIRGEIRPGEGPVFVITRPIEYDVRLKPAD